MVITSDDNPECKFFLDVDSPSTCSDGCEISIDDPLIICNDNNTPYEISDDSFFVKATINGVLAGNSWMASDGSIGVFGEEVILGPFDALSGVQNIFVLSNDVSCLAFLSVPTPPICFTECDIFVELIDSTRSDNGTPLNPSDDTFTISVLITGSHGGMGWLSADGSTGLYGVESILGPFNVNDGAVSVSFWADNVRTCITELIVNVPPINDPSIVPTLSQWGIFILSLGMLIIAVSLLRQNQSLYLEKSIKCICVKRDYP